MKTQTNLHSLSSIFRNRSPYICPACRRNTSRNSSHTSVHALPIQYRKRPKDFTTHAAKERLCLQLRDGSRRSHSLEARLSSHQADIDATLSATEPKILRRDGEQIIGTGEDGLLPIGERSNYATRENIRSRLKKWSEQQVQYASASQAAPSSFSALPPPNSLLLEDLEPEEEEDFELFNMQTNAADEEDDNLYASNELGLEPGDVFRAKLKGVHGQFAVFLGLRQRKAEVLLADGRWAIAKARYPNTVVLPAFVDSEEVELLRSEISSHPEWMRVAAEDFETDRERAVFGDLSTSLTRSLTRRLSSLDDEILSFQRDHTSALDGLYSNFAINEKFVAVRFNDLVKKVFKQDLMDLSMGARYAIFATLRKHEGRHTIVRAGSGNITIYFTPKKLYQQILDVTSWAREYQDCAARAAVGHDVSADLRKNPLNAFINKARRIILKSRKIRSPTTIGSLGPSSGNHVRADGSVVTRETGETLSSEDNSIIEFMWCTYLRSPQAFHDVSAKSVGALILRAIGAYPSMRLDMQIARLFFREMGLMAPWSEQMDHDLRIPAPGRRGALHAQNLIKRTDKLSDTLGFTEDPTNIPFTDTMVNLRKDWGNTNVYCVDHVSTSVLDDGISLEDSSEIAGATWIHVHIAHPTAFVRPKTSMEERARTLTTAIYTSAKVYPMLPDNIVNAMSLRPGAAVMTVSSLILANGEVKDVEVTVGTIRNMIRLEPSSIAAVLGEQDVEEAVLQVGPTIPDTRDYETSDYQDAHAHGDFVRKLQSLIKARTNKRREEVPDYPTWNKMNFDMSAYVSWSEIFDGSRHNRSFHYLGDPTIKLTSARHQVPTPWHIEWEATTGLTAHAMILAGESVGRWLGERNIPAVYSGTVPIDEEHTVARLNALADDSIAPLPPRALDTSRPMAHSLLGVAQYVKITSPLRRYNDNIAQWQINAYLQAEAEGHLSVSTSVDQSRGLLPFTGEHIESILQEAGETKKRLALLKKKSNVHWSLQAIFRAFHFNEAPLPAIWDAQITQADFVLPSQGEHFQVPPDVADLVASLQPFSIRTLILKSKEGWEIDVKRFQYLPVKIEYVDTTAQNVYARPVGPPSWKATQSGPLHCVKTENESENEAILSTRNMSPVKPALGRR